MTTSFDNLTRSERIKLGETLIRDCQKEYFRADWEPIMRSHPATEEAIRTRMAQARFRDNYPKEWIDEGIKRLRSSGWCR